MKPKIHHNVNWKCHTPSWQQHTSTQYQQSRSSPWKPGMQYLRYWNQIERDPNAGWEAGQWVFSFFMVTFLAAGSSHLYLGRHMNGPVQCMEIHHARAVIFKAVRNQPPNATSSTLSLSKKVVQWTVRVHTVSAEESSWSGKVRAPNRHKPITSGLGQHLVSPPVLQHNIKLHFIPISTLHLVQL